MNEMEKMAITEESTMLTTEEKIRFSEAMSMTCPTPAINSSESEKVLSGKAKRCCKSCCNREIGSSILPITVAKSTDESW